MNLSISSVITTFIFAFSYTALFCFLLQNELFIFTSGLKTCWFFLCCLALRLFLPLELPFTYSIYCKTFFTTIRSFLDYEIIHTIHLSICQLLLILWGSGIIIVTFKKIYYYQTVRKLARLFNKELPDDLRSVVHKTSSDFPELNQLQIFFCPGVSSPIMLGIKRKMLLLPDISYRSDEIPLILKHEALHLRHKDTFKKCFIDAVCTIFWWNPLFYWFQNHFLNIIELQVDKSLTASMDNGQKKQYLDCLMHLFQTPQSSAPFSSIYFSRDTIKQIHIRCNYIVQDVSKPTHNIVLTYFIIFLFFVLSYSVIFEPEFPLPEVDNMITSTEMYAIKKGNAYDIYYNDEYLLSELTLKNYPNDMEVYNESQKN